MLPEYWPWMVAYHQAREPLFRNIIRDVCLAPGARVLDAGSGDGFYSRLLASLIGPAAQIVALDLNPALLKLHGRSAPNVQRCLGDMEQPALAPGSFDAVWLCRSMHSAKQPLARLAALVPLLKPGGKLIVVENDTAHHPILPLPVDLGHRLRVARWQYEGNGGSSSAACERFRAGVHLARWVSELDLALLSVHTYVSEDLAPLDPCVESYWLQFLTWTTRQLRPFLSTADAAAFCALLDANSPDYLFSRPGCYCLELTTVAVASAPASPAALLSPEGF